MRFYKERSGEGKGTAEQGRFTQFKTKFQKQNSEKSSPDTKKEEDLAREAAESREQKESEEFSNVDKHRNI